MILAFVGITFSQTIARSGFVKKIDTNQYKEILLSEEEKMDLKSLINKKFKSKCHIVFNSYDADDSDVQSRNLRFFSDDENIFGFWGADGKTFPDDIPLFTSLLVYYHCEETSFRHESVIVRIIEGWEVVDEIRFVGQKYIATDNLKIREYSSLSAKQVRRLSKEERLTVIEVGEKTAIDGIESAWVKIQTKDGKSGWCFGGYLTDGKEYKEKPWTIKE